MTAILRASGYVPYHRLRRAAIAEVMGGRPGRGTRAVASYDEDTTTMAVAAARPLTRGAPDLGPPDALWFATSDPTYLDKTNATAIHAALRLPAATMAADLGGAPRSAIAALLGALRSSGTTLVVAADRRTGQPTSPDESGGGDAAAAVLVGKAASPDQTLATLKGSGSATREFLDRWRVPGAQVSQLWEERFAEGIYLELGQAAYAAALENAGTTHDGVDHLIVTGPHSRAVRRAGGKLSGGRDILVDTLSDSVGNSGAAQALLTLTATLETATPGATIALVSLADGADALIFTAGAAAGSATGTSIATQIANGDDRLTYAKFLQWRGMLTPQPPNRPLPARASASAAARNTDWKFGFVGSKDESSGAIHLPPSRISFDGGAVDEMSDIPMADIPASVVTFTIDRIAYSPSPPTVFAVLDFDGGGRLPCELTDVDADAVAIGDRVEMTFRRLSTADGIANYFWKARPVRGVAASVVTDGK